jgi:hypothetical protein
VTSCQLVALAAALGCASTAHAQDALFGKRLYLDAARLRGTGVSCVECHGGLPGGAFGIGSAANDPALVENAVETNPPMSPFRGRLMAPDFADLAAYIGDPAVASPIVRVTTRTTGGEPGPADRIGFGELEVGDASELATIELGNAGAIAFTITAAPELAGSDATAFALADTSCTAGLVLGPAQACRIDVRFTPAGAAGERSARIAVAHDWVFGAAAVALSGSARDRAPPPASPSPSSCAAGHGTGGLAFAVVAGWLVARRRPSRRRPVAQSRQM